MPRLDESALRLQKRTGHSPAHNACAAVLPRRKLFRTHLVRSARRSGICMGRKKTNALLRGKRFRSFFFADDLCTRRTVKPMDGSPHSRLRFPFSKMPGNGKARCANFCTAHHRRKPRHTARRDRRCAFVFRFARSARKFRRTIDNALCHERRNMDGTRNICDDGIVLTIDFFVVVLSLTRSIYFFYSNFQVVVNEYKRTI